MTKPEWRTIKLTRLQARRYYELVREIEADERP